jgi:hypothetical protein
LFCDSFKISARLTCHAARPRIWHDLPPRHAHPLLQHGAGAADGGHAGRDAGDHRAFRPAPRGRDQSRRCQPGAAARLLADAEVHSIVWNGTSGAWLGIAQDRAICAAITAATGIPATTTTLALLDALSLLLLDDLVAGVQELLLF